MNRSLVLGLALGLAVTGLAVVAAPRAAALWARARLGGLPGSNGVALAVEPAPEGVAGPGARVVVWHVNAGGAPVEVCWSDPPGDELGFEVVPEGGGAPLPPARGPEHVTVATPGAALRRVWLPPGGRVGVVVDLSRWVALPPGPGVYDVRAERVPCGDPRFGFDGVRAVSGVARVVVP